MPRRMTRAVALALLGALSACDREVDLSELSIIELVERVAAIEPTDVYPNDHSLADEALWERPLAAETLFGLLDDPRPGVRKVAARHLSSRLVRSKSLSPSFRSRAERALDELLLDPDETVRVQVLASSASSRWYGLSEEEVPGQALIVARECLTSSDPAVALSACVAVIRMEAKAGAFVPELLALTVQPDSGVRYMATIALASSSRPTPDVLDALWRALEDEDWKLRYAAASTLGWRVRDARSIPHLFAVVDDGEESWDVRKAAADSLVDLVTAKEDVTGLSEFFMSHRGEYETWETFSWCRSAARLGARVPGTTVADDVRRALRGYLEYDGLEEEYAAAALGLMACESDDLERARPLFPVLWQAFEWGRDDLVSQLRFFDPEFQFVIEVLVSMTRWEELSIDSDALRAVLDRIEAEGYPADQDWAREQLRVLNEPR